MILYSVGVKLAWEISRFEAENKTSPLIEVDHIMLGVLSLDKIDQRSNLRSSNDYCNLVNEKKDLYNTLNSNNINITAFRRKLREMIPIGNGLPSDNIFHRSEECKRMFTIAAYFADNYIRINHLFQAIMDWQSSFARQLLVKQGIDMGKLKSEIMSSFYKNN